ncbi:MAG: hypothetical protein QJT81_16400 [Candidatus Thiothrix putei]|uniref:Uncharacterized protein n=1 Tax=Candidatus Thiothrix putei TaxID=3080811 RepID=A0AA95KL09_9GAMM|nr:MAG: hypothetical protein QJT81_16400 [Candidatus Thiothrix putei]
MSNVTTTTPVNEQVVKAGEALASGLSVSSLEQTKKRTASKKQKANGIKLWNSIKDEVCLTDDFNLEGELKAKADKYLHALKIKVWRLSLAKGNTDDALKIVFGYNKAVNDLLAKKLEPAREDLIENVPAPVFTLIEECPPDSQEG